MSAPSSSTTRAVCRRRSSTRPRPRPGTIACGCTTTAVSRPPSPMVRRRLSAIRRPSPTPDRAARRPGLFFDDFLHPSAGSPQPHASLGGTDEIHDEEYLGNLEGPETHVLRDGEADIRG